MATSKRTKTCKRLAIIFGIIHLLLLLGPFLYFLPYAFITGAVVSKIALSFTVIIALVLSALTLLMDIKHRAGMHRGIMWLLIAGILVCLTAVKPFIWIMAGVSILDELVICKVKDHYKTAAATNKEIDKRM